MIEKYSMLKKRSALTDISGIKEVLILLNEMREDGILDQFAIGGGIATALYVEPYTTSDIDIFCYLKQSFIIVSLSPIYEYLQARGAKIEKEYLRVGIWPIQFILPQKDSLPEEALKNANTVSISGVETRIFTPEYLAAIALQVFRGKDRKKIQDLLEFDKLNIPALEKILQKYKLLEKWGKFLESEKMLRES